MLTELNVAYLDWSDTNIQEAFGLELPILLGQPIADYVAATLDNLCAAEPPEAGQIPWASCRSYVGRRSSVQRTSCHRTGSVVLEATSASSGLTSPC